MSSHVPMSQSLFMFFAHKQIPLHTDLHVDKGKGIRLIV